MLQLWLPRDEALDRALLHGIRSLLPSVFDSQAEEATVRILTTLARYENVDDLDENTITMVLLNQALGDRIRKVDDVRQQVELVREAIVAQHADAKAQLAAEQKRRDELEAEYSSLLISKQRIEELRAKESRDREELNRRVAGLEEALRQSTQAQAAEVDRRHRTRQLASFLLVTAVAAALAVVLSSILPPSLANSFEMSIRRARLTIYTGSFGLAGLVMWLTGRALSSVRKATWFQKWVRTFKWALGVIWTIFLGVVSTYLWERF
jgi:hypothetical protein